MKRRTFQVLASLLVLATSAVLLGLRTETGRRTLWQALAWWSLPLANAAATGPFNGIVAYQEDRSECEAGSDSGCTPSVMGTSVIAIDKDGARLGRMTSSDLAAEQWMIYGRGVAATGFPSVGKYYAIATENASPARTRAAMLDPSRDCIVALDGTPQEVTVLGREEVIGYRTIKIKHNRAGAIDWRAPDLGCFSLQSEHRFSSPNGRRDQIVRKRTTGLTLGPPAAEYFSFRRSGGMSLRSM